MKQHAIFLALLAIALAIRPVQAGPRPSGASIRRAAWVSAGIVLSFAMLVALLGADRCPRPLLVLDLSVRGRVRE
jgi:hypothetical protein